MHGDRIYITTAAVLVLQAAALMDALKGSPSSSSSSSIGSQKLPIFDKLRSGCCSCQNCCPCIPPIPGPLDGPGIGGVGGGGGGIGPANIEDVDYAIDAQTVAPISDSIGTRLFGGSLFNRLGASRRSVVLRRRTFRPNGVTLVELEEPGGGGFLTRFWPFALENGNNTRIKHVDGVKDFRYEHPEHRDEDRAFMSPKRPRAFLRRG